MIEPRVSAVRTHFDSHFTCVSRTSGRGRSKKLAKCSAAGQLLRMIEDESDSTLFEDPDRKALPTADNVRLSISSVLSCPVW